MFEEKEKNFEIIVISNTYKDTLNNFINSSDLEFSLRLIGKKSCNAPRSKDILIDFSKKNCLDKDVLTSNKSLRLVPKTRNS